MCIRDRLKAAPNAETAREFLAYLQTDRAATVFESVGFTLSLIHI